MSYYTFEQRKQRRKLVEELVVARRFIFNQLIDHAKECGMEWEAKAWEWLRDYGKYPNPRYVRSRWGYARIKKWGWSFIQSCYSLEDASQGRFGNSTLPMQLRERYWGPKSNEVFNEEEDALVEACEWMTRFLQENHERREREKAAAEAAANEKAGFTPS